MPDRTGALRLRAVRSGIGTGEHGTPGMPDADAEAYLVRVGSRVELFTVHPIRPSVGYFQVGPASFAERTFRQGTAC